MNIQDNEKIPKSLLEVRDWKESAYQEVANLPLEQALEKRIQDSTQLTKKLSFIVTPQNIIKPKVLFPSLEK